MRLALFAAISRFLFATNSNDIRLGSCLRAPPPGGPQNRKMEPCDWSQAKMGKCGFAILRWSWRDLHPANAKFASGHMYNYVNGSRFCRRTAKNIEYSKYSYTTTLCDQNANLDANRKCLRKLAKNAEAFAICVNRGSSKCVRNTPGKDWKLQILRFAICVSPGGAALRQVRLRPRITGLKGFEKTLLMWKFPIWWLHSWALYVTPMDSTQNSDSGHTNSSKSTS